ncbi:hypothetical protein HDU96_002119 [Phlyctochytrium bullatum]|nr:hypothetical protein HDU96_002119 [Phlyctochytrium bullatum]
MADTKSPEASDDRRHDDASSVAAAATENEEPKGNILLAMLWKALPYVLIFGTIGYKYFVSSGPALPDGCKAAGVQCPKFKNPTGYAHAYYSDLIKVFHSSFKKGDEIGASFTAYADGKLVAELYGGYFDDDYFTPYDRDSLQLVFSTSKAVTGIAVTYLVDQGIFDFEDKVSKYWPEFAAGGKEHVTIRDLMAHRAGVSALDPERVPELEELADLDVVAEKIAGQPHHFGGESKLSYHAQTRGWYVNELVRRAHPQKKSLGQVIREDIIPIITDPKDPHSPFEYYLNLPQDLSYRVSPLRGFPFLLTMFKLFAPPSILSILGVEPIPPHMMKAYLETNSFAHKVLFKSLQTKPGMWPETYNDERLWHSENPSFSGITNARTLARLAAFMANNGSLDGKTLISHETLDRAMEPYSGPEMDIITGRVHNLSNAGWGRFENFLAPNATWVGWAGAGGSIIMWNREHNMAFSYVMNFCHYGGVGDKRSHRLGGELTRITRRIHRKGEKVPAVEGDIFAFDLVRRKRMESKGTPVEDYARFKPLDWESHRREREMAELRDVDDL